MKTIRVVNTSRDSVLGSHVLVADSWWYRVRGYLGRPAPAAGEGLLLSPCRAVHTVGMSYSLDVVFVGRNGQVVAVYPDLEPNRRTSYHRPAEYVLELPVGTIAATHTAVDDVLAWTPADEREPVADVERFRDRSATEVMEA